MKTSVLLVGQACKKQAWVMFCAMYLCMANVSHWISHWVHLGEMYLDVAGYFCPAASVVEIKCGGSQFFCPRESEHPTPVTSGHYTVGNDQWHRTGIEKSFYVSLLFCCFSGQEPFLH